MDWLHYEQGELHAQGVSLTHLAERFGTPCYVYSRQVVEARWRDYDAAFGAFPHLVCYAVKANSNLAVLNVLARLGSGFDIVSGGELQRVLRAGGSAGATVFSGVGKRRDELQAALEAGVRCINAETVAELELLDQVAGELGVVAPVALRINPNVDPKTHPYIATGLRQNKFGIDIAEAHGAFLHADGLPHLALEGVGCHIGSQLVDAAPVYQAAASLRELLNTLRRDGIALQHVDVGGGLGIRYLDETPPPIAEFVRGLLAELTDCGLQVLLEPGRSIVADAGILLTRVESVKTTSERRFVVVDAAMNDLLRPALYDAWQEIRNVRQAHGEAFTCDVVGPVCESGDFIGRDRTLAASRGDVLAVLQAGAYGFVMASNYNTRPRPAEVLLDGTEAHRVRSRESLASLMAGETLLPDD